ncbi:type 11 methyltransferase [Synergistales bacterium]|nr:type 11 methyltransferase [Synergistales bacterium]
MTNDEILYGKLKLWQPDKGPRVSMDTVLLADYVRLRPRARLSSFIELGAATGAVSLMLALRFPEKFSVLGIEIQPELEEMAHRNRSENGFGDNVSFRCMDLRDYKTFTPGAFDGVVVNPPYEETGRGRRSPSESLSIARQSDCCTTTDVMNASKWLLNNKGRFFAVFRADRMAEFLALMRSVAIEPKRLKLVYPMQGKSAGLFLVEGLKGGGLGLKIEPPLFVTDENGQYTDALLRAYEVQRN